MIAKIRGWWPAIACLVSYYLAVLWLVRGAARTAQGALVYPLDDTYIHMAIAKNFAEHGVWGLTHEGFNSATSSPLYTGLLALADFVLGRYDLLPLLLNVLIGTVLIAYLYRLLRSEIPPPLLFPSLLVTCFAVSVPGLTVIGMEHLLHTLLTVAFVSLGARALAAPAATPRQVRALLLIAALLPVTRYEGSFAVALLGGCLLLQRRYRLAVGLCLAGAAPMLLYGLLALRQGWYLLPNSILLKANLPGWSSVGAVSRTLGLQAIRVLFATPVLLVLFMASVLAYFHACRASASRDDSHRRWSNVLFLCLMFVHLQTARVGWLFRYEAYLVGLGLVVALPFAARMLVQARDYFPKRWGNLPAVVPLLALLALGYPLAQRASRSLDRTRKATHDRFLEHIQTARFLAEYRPEDTVVVNDVGAVAYLTKCRLLDMYGLASMVPLRLRRGESGYGKAQVQAWTAAENATVAVLQTQWADVARRIPDAWVKVAEWRIPRNVVFGDSRIGWFALKDELADGLAADLRAFQAHMPEAVEVTLMIGGSQQPETEGQDSIESD